MFVGDLQQIEIAGHHNRFRPGLLGLARERGDHVVGLLALHLRDRDSVRF